jgi:hypothetical protein
MDVLCTVSGVGAFGRGVWVRWVLGVWGWGLGLWIEFQGGSGVLISG